MDNGELVEVSVRQRAKFKRHAKNLEEKCNIRRKYITVQVIHVLLFH